MKSLIMFCIGVATALAWQSYGDAAREMISSSYPQLSWLAPHAAVAQTASDAIAPAVASLDQQELKAISLGLAEVRQKVDQFAAVQEQIARDFTGKLQAAERDILDRISVPPPQQAAPPVRKPAQAPLQLAPSR